MLTATALTLVAGAALGWVGFRAVAERERGVMTHYTATTVLVRDRLAAEIDRLESELANDFGKATQAPGAWTPAGELGLYRMNYPANTVEYLTVPASGGEPRQLLTWGIAAGSFPAPLPDLKTFVVAKANRLLLVDVATGAERPITTGTAEEAQPIVSADGRLVAFVSNPDGKWAIYLAPLDQIPAASPLRLAYIDRDRLNPSAIGQRQPWWLPNGDLSMVFADAESDVFRIDVDLATGRARSAPVRLTQDAPWNRARMVSPDGRQIAYSYRRGPKAGIAVMDADGRNERPLVEQTGTLPLGWRAPGEILFYDFATPQGPGRPRTRRGDCLGEAGAIRWRSREPPRQPGGGRRATFRVDRSVRA